MVKSSKKKFKIIQIFIWKNITIKFNFDFLYFFLKISNSLRNDLNHPNEFVRGSTLRMITRIKEMDVLEPLLPSVLANLENKHAFVRKNAVFSILTIYRNLPVLIPDAPDIIYEFLCQETDQACKRNAFIMLCEVASKKAIEFLSTVIDQFNQFDENLQFVILDLIKKLCARVPAEKSKYIKAVFDLLESPTLSIKYEAASTLLVLSSSPTAVKAAAAAYIRIIEIVRKKSKSNFSFFFFFCKIMKN